ncbi:MAG: ACP S-malonyltransferase [Pseudanabaenaceae cyanobacterium]
MKTVWVFPGQGSQSVGMHLPLLPLGTEKFQSAREILGWSVIDICAGDVATLSQTQYTQPCLYTISAIYADQLRQQGQTPDLVAGHSLGEYSALYASGVWDFRTGLELVKQRSLLMSQAQGGKMVALIGVDRSQLGTVVAQQPEVVIANDNSPEQVVISGTIAGVDQVLTQITAKRVIPLPVSGAFHSPLMAEAEQQLAELIAGVEFADPQVPVLLSTDPRTPITDGATLKTQLQKQMTSPVRWREIVLYLEEQGFTEAIEVGAGKVLTGLIKRTAPSMRLVNLA